MIIVVLEHFMKLTALVSILLSSFMLIFGFDQLFFVYPAIEEGQYFEVPIQMFARYVVIILIVFIIFLLILGFANWKYFSRRKKPQSFFKAITLIEPPTKGKLELFMLISLILSSLGTFGQDRVMYGLGVLSFILPIFADPYIGNLSNPEDPKGRKRLDWDMIAALIAFIALAWELLVHYSLIP